MLMLLNEDSEHCDCCTRRYLAYIESNAWATNFKHKLACGSVVLAVRQPCKPLFYRSSRFPVVHHPGPQLRIKSSLELSSRLLNTRYRTQ